MTALETNTYSLIIVENTDGIEMFRTGEAKIAGDFSAQIALLTVGRGEIEEAIGVVVYIQVM